jgi:hypothetical protein
MLYASVAFLYFGVRLLRAGDDYVGTGVDPQIFIWSFGWWPHAILHGLNPFVTHAIWAPEGVNLAWTTTVPGLALLFSPLTLLAGAVASYNVAAVLMPALAAWTAFLLCRHLTRRTWPALVGGYLFGFSSYMLGQEQGHLHASSVFLVPLVALVVLRHVEGELDARGLAARLGVLLALQLLFGTEVFFTLTLALAVALAVGIVLVPDRRRLLVRALAPIAGAYVLAAVLTSPFVYYLLSDFQTRAFHPPQDYVTDLLNFVVPTQLALAAHGWAGSISSHFPGNDSERGAYLGVPALVVVGLYAWARLRTPGGRFLVASFLLAVLAALGATLRVDAHRVAPLPWEHVGYLPLFDNVLVERLSLYVALAVAVMVALWTASQSAGLLRWLLPALAILAIVPNVALGRWAESYAVPQFFADGTYKRCLEAGENILPLPPSSTGDEDLWQVASGFRFRMAGGYVFAGPPSAFLTPPAVAQVAHGNPVPAGQAEVLRTYIREKHVTSVVVDAQESDLWTAALDRIATPQRIAGVVLYRLGASSPRCAATNARARAARTSRERVPTS